jgi:hypothetical protein
MYDNCLNTICQAPWVIIKKKGAYLHTPLILPCGSGFIGSPRRGFMGSLRRGFMGSLRRRVTFFLRF